MKESCSVELMESGECGGMEFIRVSGTVVVVEGAKCGKRGVESWDICGVWK